ncbi:MAG: hypothetical protein Q8O13_03495 [Candidatus Omnitrophota bacterium]|nr:hypothetical protein [Candidatus Omnitrophota bacterium]
MRKVLVLLLCLGLAGCSSVSIYRTNRNREGFSEKVKVKGTIQEAKNIVRDLVKELDMKEENAETESFIMISTNPSFKKTIALYALFGSIGTALDNNKPKKQTLGLFFEYNKVENTTTIQIVNHQYVSGNKEFRVEFTSKLRSKVSESQVNKK